MTRHAWTTDDQKEWLESQKAVFIKVKQKGSTAMKEFYQASSAELAVKVKCKKYNKRMREWFHNNMCNLSAPQGAVLKIKAKPKMLQAWQAYHVLTHEKKWKPFVDKAWEAYKTEWVSENPTKKPPKNCFQIMVEFVKEKFNNETEEMKSHCEEYRQARRETPFPIDSKAARNQQMQAAIEKLPRTLVTMGESLMQQTRWYVTIMAGRPSPEHNGMILTYLSHTGKTKDRKTFTKFLGQEVYDENLKAFEKFLHSLFSQEDCASRSLVKEEMPDKDEDLNMNDSKGGSHEEGENDRKLDEDNEQAGKAGIKGESAAILKPHGPSEYIRNKEKNLEELKRRLEEVNTLYPINEFLPEMKKAKQTSRKSRSRDEPIVRRESSRIKDKRLSKL